MERDERSTRDGRPRPFAFALWMRDRGYNVEQLAAVLEIEPDEVPVMLEHARSIVRRLRHEARSSSAERAGIAVSASAPVRVIDHAATMARGSGGVLHLVAVHNAVRRTSLTLSDRQMRTSGALSREADTRLLQAARRGVHAGIDVVPHAFPTGLREAVERICAIWGRVMLVVTVDDVPSRMRASAARHAQAGIVVIDEDGQVASPRIAPAVPRVLAFAGGLRRS